MVDETKKAIEFLQTMLCGRDQANDGHPYVDPYRSISILLKAYDELQNLNMDKKENFNIYYRDGNGGFIKKPDNVIDDRKYDDGSGKLVSFGENSFKTLTFGNHSGPFGKDRFGIRKFIIYLKNLRCSFYKWKNTWHIHKWVPLDEKPECSEDDNFWINYECTICEDIKSKKIS